MKDEPLIPEHGGYRNLKSFQIAQLAYDVTVRFCDLYIEKRSRTHDQMVQAARSGVQNIAEGSVDSGTSKKMELKLTNIARASLEELRLDYEDFLRHRELEQWPPDHPALKRFKAKRCATLEEVRQWAAEEKKRGVVRLDTDEHGRNAKNTDPHGRNTDEERKKDKTPAGAGSTPAGKVAPASAASSPSVPVRVSPCLAAAVSSSAASSSPTSSQLVANAALSLLNLACFLLDRQIEAQARAFLEEGGFTERLHRIRTERRRKSGQR